MLGSRKKSIQECVFIKRAYVNYFCRRRYFQLCFVQKKLLKWLAIDLDSLAEFMFLKFKFALGDLLGLGGSND